MTTISDQMVKEHNEACFSCDVYPAKSTLGWEVNGKEVQNSKKYRIVAKGSQRQLVIKDTLEEDEGIVSAFVGDCQTQAELRVEGINNILLIV